MIGPPTSVNDVVFVTSSDSVYSPSYSTGVPVSGSGGYVYMLKKSTGEILSSFETGAGIYGGFSVDSHCAYVGYGYGFLSAGQGVYGWCVPTNLPTMSPSLIPTFNPTMVPSAPSPMPSKNPSYRPTQLPSTKAPSTNPSIKPSSKPSLSPYLSSF